MRNRVVEFAFEHTFPDSGLKDVTPCAACVARWIRDGTVAHDAAAVLQPPVPPPAAGATERAQAFAAVRGFAELVAAAQTRAQVARALLLDAVVLGAVSVQELREADWEALPAWASLRPLEKRRLLREAAKATA